jgi:phage terminase large subunit
MVKKRLYTPVGAIADLFRIEEREILLESGAGTGKSFGCLQLANYLAKAHRNSRILFVRKTRKSLNESILVDWEQKVLWPGHPAFGGSTASKEHRDFYEYPNGSRIVLGGLDNVNRIMSAQYDLIIVFEATEATLDDWEKLISRLRNGMMPRQQIIADCNPAEETHWLNRRGDQKKCVVCNEICYDPFHCEAETQPVMKRVLARHEDNPLWWDHMKCEWTPAGKDYIQGVLGSLSGARRERLLNHRWVTAEGLVFDNWEPDIHQFVGKLIQQDGTWYVEPQDGPFKDERVHLRWFCAGLDFGYRAPGSFSVWGIDAERRAWRISQVYRAGKNRDWWADKIKDLTRKYLPFRRIIADSASPQEIDFLNDYLIQRGAGAIVEPCKKGKGLSGRRAGLDLVRTKLEPDAGGRPSALFMRDALEFGSDPELVRKMSPLCTEQEIPGYVWLKNDEGKIGVGKKEEPDPNCEDHGIDETRYLFTWLYGKDLSNPEAPATSPYDSCNTILKHEEGWKIPGLHDEDADSPRRSRTWPDARRSRS